MFFFLEQNLFFRIQFPNTIFFFKTQKIVLKNCFPKQFSKTATKQAYSYLLVSLNCNIYGSKIRTRRCNLCFVAVSYKCKDEIG